MIILPYYVNSPLLNLKFRSCFEKNETICQSVIKLCACWLGVTCWALGVTYWALATLGTQQSTHPLTREWRHWMPSLYPDGLSTCHSDERRITSAIRIVLCMKQNPIFDVWIKDLVNEIKLSFNIHVTSIFRADVWCRSPRFPK